MLLSLPGVLATDPATDRLVWGGLAGRFRWPPLDEWKHGIALVAAADLTPHRCAVFALRHPRVLAVEHPRVVDGQRFTVLRRPATTAAVVVVRG